MKNTNTEKTCFNCDYFSQHYVLGVRDLLNTNYGHCRNFQTGNKLIHTDEKNPACEYWRAVQISESEGKRILSALESIRVKLCFIEELLKDL